MQESSVVQALLLTLNFVILGLVAAVLCRRVRPHRRVVTTFLLLLGLSLCVVLIACVPVLLRLDLDAGWRLTCSFAGAVVGFVFAGDGFYGKRIH